MQAEQLNTSTTTSVRQKETPGTVTVLLCYFRSKPRQSVQNCLENVMKERVRFLPDRKQDVTGRYLDNCGISQ